MKTAGRRQESDIAAQGFATSQRKGNDKSRHARTGILRRVLRGMPHTRRTHLKECMCARELCRRCIMQAEIVHDPHTDD
jgi:hypothetical protein